VFSSCTTISLWPTKPVVISSIFQPPISNI
jgi:hypothetical protein